MAIKIFKNNGGFEKWNKNIHRNLLLISNSDINIKNTLKEIEAQALSKDINVVKIGIKDSINKINTELKKPTFIMIEEDISKRSLYFVSSLANILDGSNKNIYTIIHTKREGVFELNNDSKVIKI